VTVAAALRIIARRWYVITAVFLLTMGGFYWCLKSAGIYATDALVEFLPPGGAEVTADQADDPSSAISFASSIVEQYDSGKSLEPIATTSAPLYGVGVRHALQVQLENSGNQWVDSFAEPLVEIQAVDPSPEKANAETQGAIAQLTEMSTRVQVGNHVPKSQRITVTVQPLTGSVEHIMPSHKTELTAGTAFAAAALIVGIALSVWTDSAIALIARQRALRRPGAHSPGATPIPKGT
jgi:hypothetical protein